MYIRYFSDVQIFLHSLDKPARSRTYKTIDLLKRYGNQLGLPHSRALGGGMYELRARGKQEIRMFYTFHQTKAIILHAFVKKTQKTPAHELINARKRFVSLTKI